MKNIFLIFVLMSLFGCKKEDIEISNTSKTGKLELSFEGQCNTLFYSKLNLSYSDHSESYTTGNANHIKYTFSKTPIQGNQTITFTAESYPQKNKNYLIIGYCSLKVTFNGQLISEEEFQMGGPAIIKVNLPNL